MPSKTFRLVGPGRAGLSMAAALEQRGWANIGVLGRGDDVEAAATGVALLILAVPDGVIAHVAASIAPDSTTVVCHLSGSRTLAELAPHQTVGSIHPLMSLPDPETGAVRLLDACTFAVCGDPLMEQVVADLGGAAIQVADDDRATYHAAASIAANHLVALCAQVERLAATIGVPPDAFAKLMTTSLENANQLGASSALTGPAARGDWSTIQAHLLALPEEEHDAYLAMARSAATLAGHNWPNGMNPQT